MTRFDHRRRPRSSYTPFELPEWKDFANLFQKRLKRSIIIPTETNWATLQSKPISRTPKRTKEEIAQLVHDADLLSLDDPDPELQNVVLISNDDEPVPLVAYMRQGLTKPWDSSANIIVNGIAQSAAEMVISAANDAIDSLVKEYTPPLPKNDTRHLNYKEEMAKHNAYGVYHLCVWKAVGHPYNPSQLSGDIVKSKAKFDALQAFFRKLAPVIQAIGVLFQCLDKDKYFEYLDNYEEYLKRTELGLIQVTPRACFLGLAVLRNARVAPHKDSGDVKDGWVAMCCFGNFTGGELVFPDLGIKIPYVPGDVIFFRSSVLEHFVAPFKGERSVLVFFTKKTTWEEFKGMEADNAPEN